MISLAICPKFTAWCGVIVILVLAAPSIGFSQQDFDPARQGQTNFLIVDEYQQSVAESLIDNSECSRPAMLVIPDEGRIKRRAKHELQEAMRVYVTDISKYAYCIRTLVTEAQFSVTSNEVMMPLAEQHNSAIEELQLVAEAYVERVGPVDKLFDASSRRLSRDADTCSPLPVFQASCVPSDVPIMSWWPSSPPPIE